MKSLQKRIEQLESKVAGEDYKAPYLAIIKEDGTVNVSHHKEDDFQLPSEDALKNWENTLDDYDRIQVIIVRSQGKKPIVK